MAELTLDDFHCEQCGCLIDLEGIGYPGICECCSEEINEEEAE